jgi:hypothetical protein
MPLQRLCMSLKNLFDDSPDLTHPIFNGITHLDIYDLAGTPAQTQAYPQISALPALTHLMFDCSVPTDSVTIYNILRCANNGNTCM